MVQSDCKIWFELGFESQRLHTDSMSYSPSDWSCDDLATYGTRTSNEDRHGATVLLTADELFIDLLSYNYTISRIVAHSGEGCGDCANGRYYSTDKKMSRREKVLA